MCNGPNYINNMCVLPRVRPMV